MKNSKYSVLKIIIVALIPLFLNGCADEIFTQRDKTFNGQDQVEFKPTTNTVNERGDMTDDPVMVTPLVQLISSKGTLGSDVSVQYVVDDSSTAIAGTDYNITTPSPITISSGEVSTELNIEVMADALNDGETRLLYISQQSISGGNVISSENFKTYTLIIRGATD